jgi:hypothetical protein
MRYILTFLAGVAALALTRCTISDRTNSALSLTPRKIETRVTIHVNEDPTKAIPEGSMSDFLKNVVGLKETEMKQILSGASTGFISEVRIIQIVKLSADEQQTRGITFDVIDSKFAKRVGTFSSYFGPPQKPVEPIQLRVPAREPGR